MDAQLKKGMLELCVLYALKKNNSYGYKIIADLSSIIDISESTLYPILRRLEVAKLLTVYSMEYNGRLRKYYSITKNGREKLYDAKDDWNEMKKIYEFIYKEDNND